MSQKYRLLESPNALSPFWFPPTRRSRRGSVSLEYAER